MHGIFWLLVSLLLWSPLALADTTCPALRAIEPAHPPVYYVLCTEGKVEISVSQFHTSKHSNFAAFCPNGPANPSTRGALRWHTASGLPEVCDVFTPDLRGPVRTAAMVYFVHHDLYEQEIDTSVHALVYQGADLINFDPPVPGILVGP